MKHAVILAHPKPTSFCAAIAKTCVEHLRATGHAVVMRDLYGLDFDPRLKAEELPGPLGAQAAPDIIAERQALGDVDSFIFVYPFWFNAPPAILKGYVDRVFSMGFGYAAGAGGAESLLDDKTLLSFSTSGVCGLRVLDHKHFGSIVSNTTAESGADVMEEVRSRLDDLFGSAPA
ncbi:MAG: NAD(P)H dehydrogenase [Caulobacter sp. 12-67-6]|nr:MAG: NAD(P)H dehydrogenase [Caulobacter sp. 12-67-6]